MRKIISGFLLLIAFIFTLTTYTSAHSGRTDSNGGHLDHSTGEYHYHHGYPAHDHYDIDGDNIKDCPYEFSSKKERIVPMWVYWLFALLLITSFAVGFIVKSQQSSKQIIEIKNEHKRTEQAQNNKIKILQEYIKNSVIQKQQQSEKDAVRKRAEIAESYPPHVKVNIRDPYPLSLFENFNNDNDAFSLPPGVYIEKGAYLRLGPKSQFLPYGNFTVFSFSNSNVYHTWSSCRGHTSIPPTYIMSVLETKRPCSYCCHRLSRNPKYPRWYKNFRDATIQLDIEW